MSEQQDEVKLDNASVTVRPAERCKIRLGRHWLGFSTTKVIGIDWTGSAVAVAEMTYAEDQLGLVKRFYETWPDDFSPLAKPDVAGKWLRERIDEHGMDPKSAVVVSVPRRDTALRLIEIPAVKKDELEAIVKMQIQARSSVAIDDLYLDFLPQPNLTADGNMHVLVVSVPRATVNVIQAVMEAAGLHVKMFGVGELALSALEPTLDMQGTSLSALANRKKLELVLTQDGVPVASHAAPMREATAETTKSLHSLVNRMLRSLPDSLKFSGFSHISLLGPNAESLRESFAEYFDVPTQVIETPCLDSVRLFALYQSLFTKPTYLDFLHPRQSRVQRVQRVSKRVLAMAAIAATLVVTASAGWYHRTLDAQIQRVAVQKRKLERQLGRDVGVRDSLQQLQGWESSAEWTDIWGQFASQIPSAKHAYLTKLQWTHRPQSPPRIEIEGLARDAGSVLNIQRGLLANNFQLDAPEIDHARDEKYTKSFRIKAHTRPPH